MVFATLLSVPDLNSGSNSTPQNLQGFSKQKPSETLENPSALRNTALVNQSALARPVWGTWGNMAWIEPSISIARKGLRSCEGTTRSRDCEIVEFFLEASRDPQDRRRFSGVRANQTL